MSYVYHNSNPDGKIVGDCVIRAISLATGKTWSDTYIDISEKGLSMHDMPSSNYVWSSYLKDLGFRRQIIPDTCPDCYTIREFTYEHPYGIFILGTGSHVVTVIDGNYYDIWDCGDEVPIYYFQRR